MTRATIEGATPPPAKDGGVKRKDEPADAGGDGVLADQFAREFQALVRQVKDAQSVSAGDNAVFGADSDAQREKRCVAHFGAFAQRLLALVRRLVDRTHELAADDKARVLLLAGDKLAALHEFRAADRFCYSEVVALSAEVETSDDQQPRAKDEVYVRAVFGQAACRTAVARRGDAFVRFPGTLKQLLEALQRMQHGMEVAVELERATPHQYAWLLLNGSVLVYSVARPLQTLGFEREVVAYFKWCLLCLESTVMLCTTKYILWRLQIYMAVCECLERLATKRPKKGASHLQSALACAEHAVRAVARLRKEEEMDLPLTKAVIATLRDAEAIVNALAARFRSVVKGEFFGRKAIESLSSLPDNRERVRLAVDGLEKSLHSSVEITAASELFDYALELVRPISQPALDLADSEEIDGSLAQMLDTQFPLSLHIMLIRHACRLKHVEGGDFLLELAHVRSRSMKPAHAISSELNVWRVLLDLDRPYTSETADTSDPDRLAFRDRVASTAQVVKAFVAQVSEALPISLRDLLVSTALRIWKTGATDVLAQFEDSPKPDDLDLDPLLVRKGILLIEAVYTVLRAVDFEDMVVLGEVCLRLSLLLNQEENRRKSIRTLRDFLVLVNEFRDRVVDDRTHFRVTESGHNQQALSRASFSFEMNPRYAQSDCYHTETSPSIFSRQSVGVEGSGSQLGSLHQELACIQVDAMLLMFQTELEEAAVMDAIEGDTEANTPARSIAVRRSSMLATTAAALQKEYKKNSYALVLLNIQILRRANETSQRDTELVEECFKLLGRAEAQVRELNKSVDGLPAEVIAPLESSNPRAPRIVKRCASSITVEVIPFKPSNAAARRRTIAYYMVFGKPAGAGTDVSLNNTEYPGTGEPLYAPALRVTVSGLSPNTSYVFAAAAFDEQGEQIQGIGETTKAVVALNPLPLVACYGYLAQVCSELKLMQPARRAAMYVYNIIVSKEFEDRPGWASNFFYRHALKRNVIARWPISLLDLAVQCIFVLCDAEDGAPLCDGQLTSEGLILRGRQIAVLEASKMVAIGLEIAGAATDFEQIRQLCFKGYRILLPLLHLDDSSALAFAALSTYYQALWCIPLRAWDTDTRSIASRIAFELMRIAWRHHHLTDASYSQVVKVKDCTSDHESPQSATSVSNELAYLLDSITIAECTIGRPLAPSSSDSSPSTAAVTAQPLPGKSTAPPSTGVVKAPPPGAAAATPQATPRAVEEGLPPRVSELLSQSKLNVREAFKILEPFIKTSRDSLEVFCKLCHCAIDAGEEGAPEEWMPLLKITGALGTKCKQTLKSLGLGNLLPEPAPTLAAAESAPNTARSNAKTPRAQEAIAQSVSTDTPLASQTEGTPEPELGNDDEFIYTWCGELSLIEATAQFRKLGRQSAAQVDVDCMRGPRFDLSFAILSGETEKEDTSGANAVPPLQNDEVSPNEAPPSSEEHESSVEVFRRFISRMATSCRLFGLARAWQALQTAAQLAANSLWLTWVSPETMALPEHASTLDDLTVCVDALLDMIEVVTATLKDEQSGKIDTTLSAGSETSRLLTATHNHTLSLASTTIVVSAMSYLHADHTWIANLVEFVIQSHLVAKRWFKLVQIGKKFHRLSGEATRFSERMAPVLVYAQQQYLSEQTSRLETAQAELTAFVKAFNDAEAKKKKKKSRLVVEEVLTPEEIEFRAQKAEMDRQIQDLAQEQSVRRRELDTLEQIHNVVSRTTNKCTQALDSCHHLIEKYRRFGDSAAQQQQIVSAFQYCVALCRQKRQRRLAGKALQELGDFLWEQGDVSAAMKAWNEAVDNAFNALRSTTCWREIIEVHVEEQPSTPDALNEVDGLWTCLESCVTIAKLVLFDSTSGTPTLELARMAAAAFTRIVTKCSLPHPSRSFLYGTQQIFSQIWPGRELLVDTERLDAPRFAMMLSVTAQTLLQYEHPVEAMPLIAAYEYLSTQCFEDLDHATNAHRLRLDVLGQCGRFHEAFEVLAVLLTGIVIGRDEKPRQPNALVAKLQFRDDKAIKDSSNSDVLTWLASLDVSKVLGDLITLGCNPTTARLVLVSVVKLVVALTQREPIEEEMNTTLRQVASKLASSVFTILTEALEHQVLPPQHAEEEQNRKTQNRRADGVVLETLALYHSRAEVLLQQSILSSSGGQWVTAQDLCTQCIQVALQSRAVVDEAVKPLGVACISLDSNLPPVLVYKASTLVVRARLVSAKVDMALGKYHHVIEQVRTAVDEASSNLEQAHFVRQLELLRVSARVLLGSGSTAVRELSSLRDDFISSHSCESLSYVELLRTLASLVRNQAMQSLESSNSLQRGLMLLEEAEEKLDCVLRRDGWIGADVNVSSDKRMSLFQSNVAVFVELKADIAQALMETPLGALEDAGTRMHRVLLAIDIALRAANHSIKPIAPTKARLLLHKGVVLKKMLVAKDVPEVRDEDGFRKCVSALEASIEEAIRVEAGGHDRHLMRMALMELVDLFGAKIVSGKEAEHLQAAFHYLNLALLVGSYRQTLFDSLKLQAGALTNAEKLPVFVAHAVLESAGVTPSAVSEPIRANQPPSKGSAPQSSQDGAKRLVVDAPRLVNFFVKVLRERKLLPSYTGLQQDIAVFIHGFLVQNHSTYAKICCMQSLPAVPAEDPEIKSGVISTHWMHDLSPAFSGAVNSTLSGTMSLYFTLGTVRVDGLDELARSNESVQARVDLFGTSPLLSKRDGFARNDLQDIGEQLSRLRIDMEDEDSLVIDRASFQSRFNAILHRIQRILRRQPQSVSVPPRGRDEGISPAEGGSLGIEIAGDLRDSFNIAMQIHCSLETAKTLETMFQVDQGVNNVIDNTLCYFLRDALDS